MKFFIIVLILAWSYYLVTTAYLLYRIKKSSLDEDDVQYVRVKSKGE